MALEIQANSIIKSINPANRKELGQIRISTPEEIHATVANAGKAFRQWRAVKLSERLQLVEQFRKLLFENQEDVAKLITCETGKPRVEALVSEVFAVLETCDWLKKNAARVLSPEKVHLNPLFFPGKRSYNVFEPLGVIAVVSPWNFPFSIPVATMLTALAAGNAVVLKPSPSVALIAQTAVDLFRRAGFPPDLIGLVQGDRKEAQELLSADINRVMFTGSVGGGKAIMGLAVEKLLPVTLELGGKHPAIVLQDSNLDAIAAPLLWASFTNAGQACASIERLYVEAPLAESLSKKLGELARGLRLGDGLLPDTDVGPVLDEQQMMRVQAQVDDAVAQGATVLAGGRARPDLGGYFFEPTVLANVQPSMRVLREEIFGPVLPIITVASAEEAIRAANDSDLGLGASIWTADTTRAQQLARQLEAGVVWINDGLYTHVVPDAPWGGIKCSGFGRMHSAAELRDLVYTKNIGVNSQRVQDWNYPYSEHGLNRVKAGVQLTHSKSLAGIFKGISQLLSAMLHKSGG